MQLELAAEKQHGDIVQLQEAVPFVDAGSPERDGESEAQDELRQRRLGNRTNDGIYPFNEATESLPSVAAGDLPVWSHCH